MNKKIIALAVAAGLAAPMAAQAAPTVYGKINVGIVSYDSDNAGASDDGLAVFDEASRFGVKGSEDLGSGLKAIYKLEGQVDMDGKDGTDGFGFDRDTYIGIEGNFGTVRVGRFNTAYKNVSGKMDLFADRYGDITGTNSNKDVGHGVNDQRESNMVSYTNKFGMVKLGVDVWFSETADNLATTQRDESAMGTDIGVNIKPMKGLDIGLAYSVAGGVNANTTSAHDGDTAMKLAAQWKGGPNTVNFIYEVFEDDVATTLAESTAMTLQYGFKMGKNTIAASYTMNEVDGGTETDSTQMTIGVMHALSKTTEVNVAYTTIDNDLNSDFAGRLRSGVSFTAPANGSDPSGLSVGIQHKF